MRATSLLSIARLGAFALLLVGSRASAVETLPDEREQPQEAEALPTLEACVSAHERGRLQSSELRLFESRDTLARCASADCPLAIRADCENWLAEVNRLLPTVLFVFEGARTSEPPRVRIDGEVLASELDGPIELAPGKHQLLFELAPFAPVEQELELAPGEKNRVLRVRFEGLPRRAPEAAVVPEQPRTALTPSAIRPTPSVTYALGFGALVFAATAGALASTAIIDRQRAEDQCAPHCSSNIRESIERRLFFADLAGGAALALGAGSVYTYLTRPTASAPPGTQSARVTFSFSEHGAGFMFRGQF